MHLPDASERVRRCEVIQQVPQSITVAQAHLRCNRMATQRRWVHEQNVRHVLK